MTELRSTSPSALQGSPDAELKARHRAMWASGDYPSMVESWLLSWTPEGMIGALLRTIGPFAPPPPPGAQPPPLWGSEAHLAELFGAGVDFGTPTRDVLEVTAFERPRDFGEHFKARYGPTIAAQANARRNGREAELEAALDRCCDEWDRGTPDRARFELEYLLAVGTRA
jgi:hypothetical protein